MLWGGPQCQSEIKDRVGFMCPREVCCQNTVSRCQLLDKYLATRYSIDVRCAYWCSMGLRKEEVDGCEKAVMRSCGPKRIEKGVHLKRRYALNSSRC